MAVEIGDAGQQVSTDIRRVVGCHSAMQMFIPEQPEGVEVFPCNSQKEAERGESLLPVVWEFLLD